MDRNIVFLGLITLVSLSFFTISMTQALFTDTATASSNTFSSASEFPTEETPQNIADHIVISEVQISTTSATTSDFIELYNPTDSEINLDGYRLVKRTDGGTTDVQIKAFDEEDIIAANGFYLWASSDDGFSLQIHSDVETGENIAADNSIAIRNGPLNTGEVIDAIQWGNPSGTPLTEGLAFTPNPLANQSIERKANSSATASSMSVGGGDEFKGNGYDTDNNANNFVLRTVSQPQNNNSLAETP